MNTALHKDHHLKLIALYATFAVPMAIVGYTSTKNIHASTLPTDKITLHAPRKVHIGEQVGFVLSNNTDMPITVQNQCPGEPFSVVRWDGNEWQEVHESADSKECKKEDRTIKIDPHTYATGNYKEWPHLFNQTGLYRINAQVDGYDQVVSHDLQVE